MLKLNTKGEPQWLAIAPGVEFLLAPLTSTIMGLARESATVTAAATDSDGETLIAVALAKAIAIRTVIDWRGVEGEDGKPAPVCAANIEAAIDNPAVFQKFQTNYVAQGLLLVEEGNVSSPSPSGTSAAAKNTAKPAGPSSAKTALAKSTPRKR